MIVAQSCRSPEVPQTMQETSVSQTQAWLPRAEGRVRLAFKRRGPATVLGELHQAGAARARFPSRHEGGGPDAAQAILLNTAGGLTGGDRFNIGITLAQGAAAT